MNSMSMVEELYGLNLDNYLKRKENLLKAFTYHFKKDAESMFSSSGRIELLGNHTDHNHGKVLVSAVDMDILAAAAPCEENTITFISEGYNPMVVDLDDVDIKAEQYGESIALIRGVLKGFIDRGYKIGGLQVKATSNILRGAGISSSAAFELLVCELLNYYYNDDKISRVEMAKIAQFAEMVYFGKPCGLLDQMGIALGGVNYIDFADVENPVIKTLTAKLEGYSIVLVNTGGNHSDLTEHYAQIRTDMFEVAKLFNKEVLNEINPKYLIKNIPFVYRKLGGRHALRAMHFIDENKRVERGFEALQNGDTRLFLEMINRSGESSYKLLQNCYYAGDVSQGISLGTNLTKRFLKDAAVRVHGGGFAGTILAFVPNDQLRSYYDLMRAVYGENAVMRVLLRNYGTTHVETL